MYLPGGEADHALVGGPPHRAQVHLHVWRVRTEVRVGVGVVVRFGVRVRVAVVEKAATNKLQDQCTQQSTMGTSPSLASPTADPNSKSNH